MGVFVSPAVTGCEAGQQSQAGTGSRLGASLRWLVKRERS